MKRILVVCACFFLCLGVRASGDELKLAYTINFERPETGVAKVTASVSGITSEGITLLRTSREGQGWFDILGAYDAAGKEITLGTTEGGYYVETGGSSRITVSYAIKPGSLGPYGHYGLICSKYAALEGALAFLVPDSSHEIASARFRFLGPKSWTAVTTWPRLQDEYVADEAFAPLALQLERSLLCFGNFRRSSEGFGSNTLNVFMLDSYPEDARGRLAVAVEKVYSEIYDLLGFETEGEYNVVCLPSAPNDQPVVAGAWSDGLAVTLAGKFPKTKGDRYVQVLAHFMMSGLFSQRPYGVQLRDEDWWFYPAVFRHAESMALSALGKSTENAFYTLLYTNYVDGAAADYSPFDMPIPDRSRASAGALAFMRETKAPVLAMRLDYELRTATGDVENLQTLIKAVYDAGRSGEDVSLLDVIFKATGANFESFYDRFLKKRSLILPMWPAFIEKVTRENEEGPGPVAARVDGVPIYEAEVALLAAATTDMSVVVQVPQLKRAALNILIDEKLMDKALAQRRVHVIPEVFWQLRWNLPPRVLRLIIAKKRHTIKDLLLEEWKEYEREGAEITSAETDTTAPAPRGP